MLCPALQARAPSPQAARRYRAARGRAQARDRAAGTAVFTLIRLQQYNPRVLPPHHASVPHHRRGATTRQDHRDGLPQNRRLQVGLAGAARARPAAGAAAGEPRRHGTHLDGEHIRDAAWVGTHMQGARVVWRPRRPIRELCKAYKAVDITAVSTDNFTQLSIFTELQAHMVPAPSKSAVKLIVPAPSKSYVENHAQKRIFCFFANVVSVWLPGRTRG